MWLGYFGEFNQCKALMLQVNRDANSVWTQNEHLYKVAAYMWGGMLQISDIDMATSLNYSHQITVCVNNQRNYAESAELVNWLETTEADIAIHKVDLAIKDDVTEYRVIQALRN